MVPVSRRGEDETADMGNRIAFVFITLPVHLRDPFGAAARDLRRDRRVQGQRAGGRRRDADDRARAAAAAAAGAGGALRGVAADVQPRGLERAGPADAGLPARRGVRRGAPGHPALRGPRVVGRRLHAARRVCFGVYADPEALPQVGELPAALGVATLELSAIAAQPAQPQRKPRAAAGATMTARPIAVPS